ncbi:alpha-E domain-containing protein [Rhodovulum visakhapatnamense]|uniref:Putative alpha-E superfamily protein n=1 Tax=Rhodovulum visakhapatnamense TaxID=364297 RepID=A0A4R8FBH5_9RHOB|nr:alpha-E domain-containing protein [Rhodovulum visakhapatnamense]TDX22582.1 putative alpha-E superfamily protein [Rhodovulum visakhapatnamense]
MLGKTANGLFWMYRYIERAENISRLVETGQRIALTRLDSPDDEWVSVMKTAGVAKAYKRHHETVTKEAAIDWMLRAKENPSSVLSAISSARQNARVVRTALTHDVWEAMNGCYMALKDALSRRVNERDLPAVIDLIKERTALVRGTTQGTLLRNDIFNFARIGTFLERADNIARILDVKYYVLLPSVYSVGSSIDNVQWETILRAVSARGGYRMVHGSQASPRDIAQFLVLDRKMPRSLEFSVTKIRDNLEYLALDYGDRHRSHELAEALKQRFTAHDIDAIFDYGLHEFLQDVLGSLNELGQQIEKDYRFYE